MKQILMTFFAALPLSLSLSIAPSHANDWSILTKPGAIAVMRHALAPGMSDPAHFAVDECSTQRNLNDQGRAQARRIGQILRDKGIEFDAVLSSLWCRCLDTAREMALGTVKPFEPLNSFFENRANAGKQTEATRQFLAAQPKDKRLMLVTHQVNITALTSVYPSSGEIVVITVSPEGTVAVLGTILIDP